MNEAPSTHPFPPNQEPLQQKKIEVIPLVENQAPAPEIWQALAEMKNLDYSQLLTKKGQKLNKEGKNFARTLFQKISANSANNQELLAQITQLKEYRNSITDRITITDEQGKTRTRVSPERMVFTRVIQSIVMNLRNAKREQMFQARNVEGSAVGQIIEKTLSALKTQFEEKKLPTAFAEKAAQAKFAPHLEKIDLIFDAVESNRDFLIKLLVDWKKMDPAIARETVLQYEKELGLMHQINRKIRLVLLGDETTLTTEVDQLPIRQMVNTIYGTQGPNNSRVLDRHNRHRLFAHAEKMQALENYAQRYHETNDREAEIVMAETAQKLEIIADELDKLPSTSYRKSLRRPGKLKFAAAAIAGAIGIGGALLAGIGLTPVEATTAQPQTKVATQYVEHNLTLILEWEFDIETSAYTEIKRTLPEPVNLPIPDELKEKCLTLVEDPNGDPIWVYNTEKGELPEGCQPRFAAVDLQYETVYWTVPAAEFVREEDRGDLAPQQKGAGICLFTQLSRAINEIRTKQGLAKFDMPVIADILRTEEGMVLTPEDMNKFGALAAIASANDETDPQQLAYQINYDRLAQITAIQELGIKIEILFPDQLLGQATDQDENPFYNDKWYTIDGRLEHDKILQNQDHENIFLHRTGLETPEKTQETILNLTNVISEALARGDQLIWTQATNYKHSNRDTQDGGKEFKNFLTGHAVGIVGMEINQQTGETELIAVEGNGGVVFKLNHGLWTIDPRKPLVRIPLNKMNLRAMGALTIISEPTQADLQALEIEEVVDSHLETKIEARTQQRETQPDLTYTKPLSTDTATLTENESLLNSRRRTIELTIDELLQEKQTLSRQLNTRKGNTPLNKGRMSKIDRQLTRARKRLKDIDAQKVKAELPSFGFNTEEHWSNVKKDVLASRK